MLLLRGFTRPDPNKDKYYYIYLHCLSTRWLDLDVNHPNMKHVRDETGSSWVITPFYQQCMANNSKKGTSVLTVHKTTFLAHFPIPNGIEDWPVLWCLIPSFCQLFLPCDLSSALFPLPANTGWGPLARGLPEFKGQSTFTCNST